MSGKTLKKPEKSKFDFHMQKNLEYDSLYDRTLICEFFANVTKKWNFKSYLNVWKNFKKNLKNPN